MALAMVKLVDLKRRKWQSKTSSKLQNSQRQVLDQCLPAFSRLFSSLLSFRKTQEKGRKNPSSSVEIPEDLIEEILPYLPVKSLLRFKSVSRGWKSLIESGHLAKKHLRLHQKKYGVEDMKVKLELSTSRALRAKYFTKYTGMGADNRESEAFFRVAGSCDGLLCTYDRANVYLINPLTKVVRTLTPPQGTILSVGFGRDVVKGTYKVVVVYNLEIMVFDLDNSEWRWRYKTAGPKPLSLTQISRERNPIFVNGSLFWLLTLDRSEILVMDLHSEKFGTVSQPKDLDVSSGPIYMWSQEDRLCVSNITQGLDSYIWVLVQEEKWEEHEFAPFDIVIPPLESNSAWITLSLVSPYH